MFERIKQRKDWLVVSLIGASLASAGWTVSMLNNPELTETEQIVNKIIESQELYFEKNGRYWQGLVTDTRIPTDRLTPTNLGEKPYYQKEYWSELVTLPETLPFQIEVHQYERWDKQRGYQVVLRKQEMDTVLERSIGFGPEQELRTWNWKIIKSLQANVATTTSQ